MAPILVFSWSHQRPTARTSPTMMTATRAFGKALPKISMEPVRNFAVNGILGQPPQIQRQRLARM